jgi:hypothetical protein
MARAAEKTEPQAPSAQDGSLPAHTELAISCVAVAAPDDLRRRQLQALAKLLVRAGELKRR